MHGTIITDQGTLELSCASNLPVYIIWASIYNMGRDQLTMEFQINTKKK
jgi:hypothetical protein